jgi:predicted metal-dependent peptidase
MDSLARGVSPWTILGDVQVLSQMKWACVVVSHALLMTTVPATRSVVLQPAVLTCAPWLFNSHVIHVRTLPVRMGAAVLLQQMLHTVCAHMATLGTCVKNQSIEGTLVSITPVRMVEGVPLPLTTQSVSAPLVLVGTTVRSE